LADAFEDLERRKKEKEEDFSWMLEEGQRD